MDPPTASVIICVYNRAAQAQTCLGSLLAMDNRNFEVVLVDDASTDNTPEVLHEFRQSHPEVSVTIIRNERNLGIARARNAGLNAARGEFVFFTDSDCTVHREWLGALVRAFDDTDVVAVAGSVHNDPPRTLTARAYAGTNRVGQRRHQGRNLVGCNMGFRREVILRYLFDEPMTYGCDEDDVAWRMRLDGCRFAFAPEAVVYHHHLLDLRGYMRMAYRQGRGAARFWYKRGVYLGRDVLAPVAALVTLPLVIIDWRLLGIPLAFGLLQTAVLIYNEVAFKGKAFVEALRVLPVCALYSACKTGSVLATLVRFGLGAEADVRESKRRWLQQRHAIKG